VAAAIGVDDHPSLHADDTVAVAAGIGDPRLARILADGGPDVIDTLVTLGIGFDRAGDGSLALGREAGHSRRRIVHANGDATGAAVVATLAAAVRARPGIELAEHTTALDLIRGGPGGERVVGVVVAGPGGRREALDRLFELVYGELRGMAHRRLRRVGFRGGDATLSTTVLVHEAYLKLTRSTEMSLNDRQHFFAVAGHAMRQIVIDRARRVTSEKRGGGLRHLTLDDVQVAVEERAEELVALDTALGRLEAMDTRLAKLVELRFFAGRTLEEIAELEGRSERTLKRDWRKARAFLYRELEASGVSQ